MSEPFIGEIRMFGFNFAPAGWALCNGQLLSIASNPALFSLLGTTYGGDGRNTFGLPDLRGRGPMHFGQGPGLSSRVMGQTGGSETVTLVEGQMPAHHHAAAVTVATSDSFGNQALPGGHVLARADDGEQNYATTPDNGTLAGVSATVENAGSGQAHENMPPFTVVNFCIALVGLYPS